MNTKTIKQIEPLLGVITFIAFWSSIVSMWHPYYIVSPTETFNELLELFSTRSFYQDIFSTLVGTMSGLIIGNIIGILFGLIFGYFFRLFHFSSIVIDLLRSIPATALFPLFFIIFGVGIVPKIALISFTITWIMLINSIYGVRYTSTIRKKIARLHDSGIVDLFRDIIFPEALPHIFAGLRIAVSTSLILMITFEMFFGSDYGLGHRIYESSQTYRIPELYATIFISGSIGYIFNKIVLLIEKKYLHWVK